MAQRKFLGTQGYGLHMDMSLTRRTVDEGSETIRLIERIAANSFSGVRDSREELGVDTLEEMPWIVKCVRESTR